ncbi:H-2 class II histocompatibility antigen, A-U alpha chain-like [Megalobrama amblycephala]|uniref:H-2 class II histocompatibility antigen, A-U alpha chain-like n=1 Tax=Megalobrama amblycephala TaxID=75352 RepID=UPI002013D710|nr:H-2 class II histocompatibility antigen, A-U alpha chain-like [Megalobrama amblycephala]
MKLCSFILMLIAVVSTEATFIHKDIEIRACSDTEKEVMIGTDGEEIIHADFNRKEAVVTLPDFAVYITYPGYYDLSVGEMETCKNNLVIFAKGYKNPVEQIDPPQTSMYSKDDVLPDVNNTLICHVTGFFPPPITVSWTKNDINVTDNIKVSQYRPNSDGTYNFFAYLTFVPEDGDIYTCTVNHKSLEEPQTKTWDVEVSVPSVGPAVFCGVGLALGLMGVATGTFFLVKGNSCD